MWRNYVIYFPGQFKLMEIHFLHINRNQVDSFQYRRIICQFKIHPLLRPVIHEFLQETEIPLKHPAHPPARIVHYEGRQVVHQFRLGTATKVLGPEE